MIIKYLKKLSLEIKISLLFIFGIILYLSTLLIGDIPIEWYVGMLSTLTLIFLYIAHIALQKKSFNLMLGLWLFGTIIYLAISLPRIYSALPLSPYIDLKLISHRWLYTISYSIRLLGTFSIGLIFMSITSPIEFLKWKKIGIWITLLFRSIEFAIKAIDETRIALILQNSWPEKNESFFKFRDSFLALKKAHILVLITIRNVIKWFPWAYLCFRKLRIETEEG